MSLNNALRSSRSARMASDPPTASDPTTIPPPPTVTFCRRTLSGRYVNYSRDDSEFGSGSFSKEFSYHVDMPPTPDNQIMEPSISAKVEEQLAANSLFTGGFNSVTRAHMMDKVTETNNQHPQMAGSKGSSCAVHGCDGKVMTDGRGVDILPCECDYKICRECFIDAVKTGDGLCPGCHEAYKATEVDELVQNAGVTRSALSLPPPPPVSKMERRLSLMKSMPSRVMSRSQTGDFEYNRWLFETKGTYGYGNAIWPQENGSGENGEQAGLVSKPWRPLTRKLKIPAAVLSPYRY